MKKLEDFRLPEVGSEKVKACMQEAVERALQWQKDIEADGESQPITVGVLRGTFRTLSDCDFENRACANYRIKKIVDTVINDITADEFLDMLNDAYAIAIHAANRDYPEYDKRSYYALADTPLRSSRARDIVLAFGAYLFKKYEQSNKKLDILTSESCKHINTALLLLESTYDLCEEEHKEQEALDILIKQLNPTPHPVEKLLDAMVRYAENLTAKEWSKKRVIGHMIHSKGAAGRYIPYDVYQKYEKRIDALAMFPEPEKKYSEDNNKSSQVAQEIEPLETHATATAQDQTGTDASNSTDTTPPSQSGRGRRAKPLFSDPDVSGQQAALFLSFLESENLMSNMINCEQDNEITASFLCFCDHWKNAIDGFKFAAAAGARFLAEDCALSFDCGIEGYGNILRRENEKARKPHWNNKVENFLNEHS